MKIKHSFLFCLFICIGIQSTAQAPVTLKGKVVELLTDKTKPVPGVVVSVSGESYDVTGPDGSFKLFAPDGLDFVTITVKGSQSNMLAPFEGKVNMPPMYQPIVVRLCNENNKKLISKVNELNTRIKTLQKNNKLSARQVELLHKTMIDTIEYYQIMVDNLATKLGSAEKENNVLQARIIELEKKNAALEEKLFLVLGEKYTEQQKQYSSITALLNVYISRIKDLHRAIPGDAMACVEAAPQACSRFYNTVEQYNKARNVINENKDLHVKAVEHYWTNPEVALALDQTYTYILKSIHEPLLFEKMNTVIIDPIKSNALNKSKKKPTLDKISVEGTALAEELKPMIEQLDTLKSKLNHLLSNSVQ